MLGAGKAFVCTADGVGNDTPMGVDCIQTQIWYYCDKEETEINDDG